VWINPYIAQESKLFDEGEKNGMMGLTYALLLVDNFRVLYQEKGRKRLAMGLVAGWYGLCRLYQSRSLELVSVEIERAP
jgi:hypothetical protein